MSDEHRTTAPSSGRAADGHGPLPHYEIRVEGHLGRRWATWFDGMDLRDGGDGTTVIAGPVIDQAALHGVLQKLRDLGISLRSLTRLPADPEAEHPAHHSTAPGARR